MPWVAQEFEGQDFLQITWTDIEPDTFGLAQLANDAWFYSPTGEVVAIDIDDLPLVLATYELVLPADFPFPRLDFKALSQSDSSRAPEP